MFVSVSREASECRLYAEQCADKARFASDPKLRQDFLDMEQRWLGLARCYEFPERLESRNGRMAEPLSGDQVQA